MKKYKDTNMPPATPPIGEMILLQQKSNDTLMMENRANDMNIALVPLPPNAIGLQQGINRV